MAIDPETGVDDDYDESIKWAIQEIIDNIHEVKSLDDLRIDSLHYALFGKELAERWEEYKKECEV